jgi:dTDP-4-dehydrorhamnose 3,5-epimerase
MMKITSLKIPDVKKIEPLVFKDERGFFFEQFNEKKFSEALGKKISFVQDNQSYSKKGVLRGLHYQLTCPQAKLVSVSSGIVFDVAVDLRKSSPSFGHWIGEILSGENKTQLYIPEGFAHGFLVLSEGAIFNYKVSNFWNYEYERCIIYDDKNLNIKWPNIDGNDLDYNLSEKDKNGQKFLKADVYE